MNIKHPFVNAPVCTVQAFLVFYIHKIRYSKNMNKVKQTDKYTICHTIKQMYKWNDKKNSALFFSQRSTNINVQVSNSYKRNLKVIKCKWSLHSFHCMYW